MQATTIKLDGEILKGMAAVRPKTQTLTAFVREVLQKDLQRRQRMTAAQRYREFLESTPAEQQELQDWEAARLVVAPRRKRR